MSDSILLDGRNYISANDAARSAGLSRDYVARLCREGKILGRRIGTHWYINDASLKNFLIVQEHAKSIRVESLAQERARDYHAASFTELTRSITPAATVGPLVPAVQEISRVISARSGEIKQRMGAAVAGHARDTLGKAKHLLNTPGGLAHAALQTFPAQAGAHLHGPTISPLLELFHKTTALFFTLVLTVGLYALLNPPFAQSTVHSAQTALARALDSYDILVGGMGNLIDQAQKQMAYAAEHPQAAVASVESAVTEGIPEGLSVLARDVTADISALSYATLSLFERLHTSGIEAADRGAVTVSVVPYESQDAPLELQVAAYPADGVTMRDRLTDESYCVAIMEREITVTSGVCLR